MREVHHAPGTLERVREFVNTLDVEEGTDELASPAAATRWLREHGLFGRTDRVEDSELERLTGVREALRRLLLANNSGAPETEDAWATLNAGAERVGFGLRFGQSGVRLASGGRNTDAAIGELLLRVEEAMREGTWERLKVCPAEDCLWAFYDRSRNRSATWCEMGECGNRNKARAWRQRQRGSG